jgi:DNA mismatch repair protein MutS
MASRRKKTSSHDTPVMRQFREIKGRYPDALLFFRMGDFYELFYEDAVTAARVLGLALTSRDKDVDDPVPMCGVPHHSVKTHLEKLLDAGHKVAVCEQLEDPARARGIVARDVVSVVTPGSKVDMDMLRAGEANYLACVVSEDPQSQQGAYGCVAADISTGEMLAVRMDSELELAGELARLSPREVLLASGDSELEGLLAERAPRALRSPSPAVRDYRDAGRALSRVREFVPDVPSSGEGALGGACLTAAASVLDYLARTQPGRELPIRRIVPVRTTDHLVLDDNTIDHLELVASAVGDRRATLVGFMDHTRTSMGSRLLRSWVLAPLTDVAAVRRRQDGVAAFVRDPAVRDELRRLLADTCDGDRVTSRVVLRAATPREVGALRDTLSLVPRVEQTLSALADPGAEPPARVPAVPEGLAERLERTLVDAPPPHAREGGIFRRGTDEELDRLMHLSTSGKAAIAEMEATEREATGIGSLKIKYNKVFGYFIEVTRPNLHLVPEDRYTRKQTLATGERYLTAELEDLEAQILTADEKRKALEAELFGRLLDELARHEGPLRELFAALARLDVLASLAHLADRHRYVRPRVDASGCIHIRGGRHPVVETFGAPDGFVPNDVDLDVEAERLWILTGPNMSGKSTFMRQVALACIMAQAGSFIPAESARVGVCDRIFTRVGASDNLAWGQSTFMVEMIETASILRHATRRSLVVLDEIGRGTSTFDGLSIAWAVAEHLHDTVGARTLFATHYHEMTELARTHAHAVNYNVSATEYGDGIVFLRKVERGGASRSYGIQVARLAGLPDSVLDRARSILEDLEAGGEGPSPPPSSGRTSTEPQLALFAAPDDARLRRLLAEVEVDELTPLEALNLVSKLKEMT